MNAGWSNLMLVKAAQGSAENGNNTDASRPTVEDVDEDSTRLPDIPPKYSFDDHHKQAELTWTMIVRTLPVCVPRTYEIILKNHETRRYELNRFYQRWYILMTDSSSW
jgi:hypothetical protein